MSGPRYLLYTSVALALMCAGLVAGYGTDAAAWGLVVRATARTSLVLFTAAYVASSLRALWRNDLTRWLLANRRYVGLSYAVSHTLHLGAIVELARVSPDFELNMGALIIGGGAYVLLYLMAITSNDRAVKLLGLANWRRLHRTGLHYNWFIFFQSFVPRAFMDPFYIPFALVVVGAAALRFTVWMRGRRRRASVGGQAAVESADG